MWTAEGRRLARARTEKLHVFRDMWDEEISGKDYMNTPMEASEQHNLPGNGMPAAHGSVPAETATSAMNDTGGSEPGQGQHAGYAAHACNQDTNPREIDPGMQLMGEMYGMR